MKTKIYSLAALTFVFQSLVWWYLHLAFIGNPSTGNWFWLALFGALTMVVTSFFFLVNKSRLLSLAIVFSSLVVYLAVMPRHGFVWLGGVIFALFAVWYEERLHREAESRADFAITRVMGSSVSVLIYGLLLLLGLNIYYNVSTDFKNNPDKYYNRLGQQAARATPYVSKVFPDFSNLNEPVSNYFLSQAEKDPTFQKAGSFERQYILIQIKQAFQRQFQITVDDNQTLADIIADVAVAKIKQSTAPYAGYLPIIFTLFIMGLLYTFAFLIRWAVLGLAWLLFHMLLGAGFFHYETVQVEVKKLTI